MILERETEEEFGYKFSDLSSGSQKKVKLKCDYCGLIYESCPKQITIAHKKLAKDACVKCKYIKREEIGDNPFSRPEVKEKIKQHNRKKYGCDWHTQSENFKNKAKKTNLDRYGAGSYLQSEEGREKFTKTMIEKHGVENPSHLPEVRDKARKTTKERYGEEYYIQTEEGKERITKTVIDVYGVSNVFQNEEIKKKIVETNIKRYGYKCPLQDPNRKDDIFKKGIETKIKKGLIKIYKGKQVKDYAKETGFSRSHFNTLVKRFGFERAVTLTPRQSSLEVFFEKWLEEENIDYRKQIKIKDKYADFVIDNLVIECDGLYWHSEASGRKNDYHQEKRKIYIDNGYTPLFFREDEIYNKFDIVKSIILNKLGRSKRIFARKCSLKKIDKNQAKNFFNENHLMGYGAGESYALIYEDRIVAAIQIKNRNIEEKIKEVSRFCTHLGVSVIGGFTKLLKAFSYYHLYTFIDQRYGQGDYLTKLGFKHVRTNLSFKWTDGFNTYNRMQFPSNSGYEKGLLKIWDCGQSLYIKENS